jgi:hypothetical protein
MHQREGIEPRNYNTGKDDAVMCAEVTTSITVIGEGILASPGSVTMACATSRVDTNPGGPAILSRTVLESMPDNRKKAGRQMCRRESDRFVVPMTAGNAARGKETTD